MKKWMIILLTVIISFALIITILTGGFKQGLLSKKIYYPQNVYEEIWNLVLMEQHTKKQTVLTTSTKDAEADFDLGVEFVGIHIPECNLTIGWRGEGKVLSFLFFLGNANYVLFLYNYETKTLSGGAPLSYLTDNFLTDYFEWCEVDADYSSKYSAEHLGDFKFQYAFT